MVREGARADIVKISDEDMEWLGTDPATLLQGDTTVVLVTLGAEGVDVVTGSGTSRVPARRVEVVDTVGAGDTFNAGFLAGLHKTGMLTRAALASASAEDLGAAANLGVRSAAVTVSRAGANPPWESEL